jgi:gas vesicle protein
MFPNYASNAGGMPAKVVMYFHCLSKTGSGSVLSGMGTPLMPDDAQREVGIDAAGCALATGPSSGGRSRSLSRKRSRHDTVTSLRIEGLEWNKIYESGESRKTWSESCNSLAQSLREARSTIEALNKDLQGISDDDDDERAELLQEIEEMKHLKRSIRKQITETRRSGGDANDN